MNLNQNPNFSVLTEVVDKWTEFYVADEIIHKTNGHNFNVFYLLNYCGIKINEVNHSKLLKFLLEPNPLHGQGDAFLILFLKQIGIIEPEKGKWTITTEEGNIDLLLKRKSVEKGDDLESVIIIENKSNYAENRTNQLYRYWHKAIYPKANSNNSNNFQIIYLTPHEYKKPDDQTLTRPKDWDNSDLPETLPIHITPLTFKYDLYNWLEKCLERMNRTFYENYPVINYLTQYKNFCKTL